MVTLYLGHHRGVSLGNISIITNAGSQKHNNISAIKAYDQFLNACELMSLTESKVKEIRNGCKSAVQLEMEGNTKKIKEKSQQLEEVQEKLFSVEEKWIKNEISRDT